MEVMRSDEFSEVRSGEDEICAKATFALQAQLFDSLWGLLPRAGTPLEPRYFCVASATLSGATSA